LTIPSRGTAHTLRLWVPFAASPLRRPLTSNVRRIAKGLRSLELFTPLFPQERWHPHFKTVLSPFCKPSREVVTRWADGFTDRDGKFVQEFQLSFNSPFWELYLHAVIKDYGYTIDWSKSAPDFSVLVNESKNILIEAVTANAADGKPNEWDKKFSAEDMQSLDLQKLNHEAMVRLSSAIYSKHRKYCKDYASQPHVQGRPFVLAVAPFEQPYFNHQYNRPIKSVLYDHYVDEDEYLRNPSEFPNGPRSKSLGFVTKDNGVEIELGFFNDDRMREISAVMFSCTATWGKVDSLVTGESSRKTLITTIWGSEPDGRPIRRVGTPDEIGETITDGLQIYHNPYAIRPLDPAVFRKKGVVQVFFDGRKQAWVEEELARSLFIRQAFSFMPDDEPPNDTSESA
ncbi:hypothetical protein, partial [Uliginosibacterium sp. TH139]|uniref:hypothetical protein n=1 Tax=Uliginosibacterium sp. TH139 TaxID=2067453 RepID=UPI001C1F750B